jgi:hypothetical protein
VRYNIQFKDSQVYSSYEECLQIYYNKKRTSALSLPIERYIICTPRIFMQPESSHINIFYKNRQITHLQKLRLTKTHKNSEANTHYETNRNTIYTKEELDNPTVRRKYANEFLIKNINRIEALRSPLF